MVLAVLTGWLDRQEHQAVAYLMEENRVLRRQLRGQRLQFTDNDRRRLAVRGHRLGRQVLRQIASVVTPDTILRWHRQLIARKWTYANKRSGRHGVLAEIRRLVMRMAEENPTWGYTRIQGALKNVGHRVGRSTIARILKASGLAPVPDRRTSWQTFLRAHWGAVAGADFFTTEVWTWRGLVTYYTVFVIDVASRRVQIVGSTPHPDSLFMRQASRTLTAADGLLGADRVLICDRDRKWSRDVRQLLGDAGVLVMQTPFQAPNANAYAERFVRSIKHECLDRMVPLGERHFRRALREFVDHYHRERNHQGLENRLIDGNARRRREGGIHRRPRLGGLLNYYERAA
jgi:transposase InsO family protein